MEWHGSIRTSVKDGEPLVTLEGGAAVPRKVTLEITGAERNGVRDPDATFVFEFKGVSPICTSVNIRSGKRGVGVTSELLQWLNVENLMRSAFLKRAWKPIDHNMESGSAYAFPLVPDNDFTLRQAEQLANSKSNMLLPKEQAVADGINMAVAADADLRARSRRNDSHLREVAAVYLNDTTGKPTAAVAEAFGLTWRTASRRVRDARDLELIPEPEATTEAYERARQALESNEKGGDKDGKATR